MRCDGICNYIFMFHKMNSAPKVLNDGGNKLQNIKGVGAFQKREWASLRALEISVLFKNHIFRCMDKIFCVEFQRVPYSQGKI